MVQERMDGSRKRYSMSDSDGRSCASPAKKKKKKKRKIKNQKKKKEKRKNSQPERTNAMGDRRWPGNGIGHAAPLGKN